MSSDVFFQGFVHGERAPGGGEAMRQALQPHIEREEREFGFAFVRIDDGTADVYLGPDGMMANHVSGESAWNLLVRGAASAGWVILPVGRTTCITNEDQRRHLPDGLDANVVLVESGGDLLEAIGSS